MAKALENLKIRLGSQDDSLPMLTLLNFYQIYEKDVLR